MALLLFNDSLAELLKQELLRATGVVDNRTARKGSGGTLGRHKWPVAVLHTQSMESCAEWALGVKKKRKIEKSAGKKKVSEAEEERKASDIEKWRPLKASIEQSVITEEEGRQTASLSFWGRHEKTCINFQVEGSLAPAASSSLC